MMNFKNMRMQNKNRLKLITGCIFIFYLITIPGCESKLDLSQFPISNNGSTNVSDTLYAQQSPTWNQFNGPEDVLVGKEPLIYVADTKNNSIVQLDLAGGFISSRNFGDKVYPKKIVQDGNFDLLVLCDSVSTANDTISIIYRLKMVAGGGIVGNAPKYELILSTHPTPNISKIRKFTGISVYPDNTFLISRRGPEDPYGIDPGNAILLVRADDTLRQVTVLGGFQSSGNSFYSIENISSIIAANNSSTDFIISRSTPDTLTLNKLIWFVYNTVNGTFDPKFTSQTQDIVNIKLGSPDGLTQDNNYNVYCVDSYVHHLYKFNSQGKLMKESFGTFGAGENQLNSPKGVSHFNKVLYIADTGNNRIVRYKLSTETN